MSATAGVNFRDVTSIVTCSPPVPLKEYRSAKRLLPNTGDVQPPVARLPATVCPGEMGNGDSPLHSMNVAAKSSSAGVVKLGGGGVEVYVGRVGVTGYVVPGWKPVCAQNRRAA